MIRPLRVLKAAAKEVVDDKVLTFAAALAFYTALSLPPLLVLLVWLLSGMSNGAEDYVRTEVGGLMGEQGTALVNSILENSDESVSLGGITGWIGLGALFFAASGVFTQLQMALNQIWEVEARPGGGIGAWLRKRFLSFGLIGVFAFLAAVSLMASAALGLAGLSGGETAIAAVFETVASFALFTGLFAAVFKFLPDVKLGWRDVTGGAAVTAFLFLSCKTLIGFYLAKKGVGQEYGAAGSAVAVLVWVYFSAAVVLVGAEVTQAWLVEHGRALHPNKYAVKIGASSPGSIASRDPSQ